MVSSCRRMAPAANRDVSVMIENGHITSGMDKTGPEEKAALRVSNTRC